ncbi:Protein of unknown function [Halolactibacillus halophilus]|uniref:Resolvase HTH domain-containing protein n=2 Tax=Halolactibacillus halophilus TaxID=306540 RepID=A0A1I5MP33_9BACI|nr:zinc-finger domain-containing protein [Halolactibacillus halophilus]SFP11352.1 Protein of unknown function [Halolactibacillus halophilus]
MSKQRRLKILSEIDHLNDNFCNNCEYSQLSSTKQCRGCPVFKQLNDLGNQLCMTKQRGDKPMAGINLSDKDLEKTTSLRDQGKTYREIAEHFGIKMTTLYDKHKKFLRKADKKERSNQPEASDKKDGYDQLKKDYEKIKSEHEEALGLINAMAEENSELQEELKSSKEMYETLSSQQTIQFTQCNCSGSDVTKHLEVLLHHYMSETLK